jgi:Protein of unknown function (DUF2510)
MNQGNPPPNWYPDPKGEAELRYWDGVQWTDHTHSGQAAAAPAPATLGPQTAPAPQAPPPAAASAPPTQAGYQDPQAGYQQPQAAYQQPPTQAGPGPAPSGGGGNKLPLIIGAVVGVIAIGVIAFLLLSGGDDKPTEEETVKDTAEEIATTNDKSACTELATKEFLQKISGESGAAAVEECEDSTTEPFGDSAEIAEPDITGNKATVEATLDGGQLDGETIEMSLVKEGEDWKLDELVRNDLIEGSKAEQTVENTVLNFGSSEGPKACDYLSYSGLQRLNGKKGCQKEFKDATAANYTAEDVSVSGKTATVTVTESRQNKTISFRLVHEAGNWKIESFQQQ